jgi:D-alanine transaminase
VIVHFNGKFLSKSGVAISPDDRGFLFADGLYEVVRAYRGHLFKCSAHLERLSYGLKELRISGADVLSLEHVAARLLLDNGLQKSEATIYFQVTRGTAPRTHRFPPTGTPPTVYVEAKPFLPPLEERQKGVAAMLMPDQRWSRCDLKTIGLLPNILAHQRAREAGAFEAIFCRDGLLQEGSHSSILFVKDSVLIAPPQTNRILPGITRQVLFELAESESIKVEIRPCRESKLFDFHEVLMAGTASEIIPIIKVNGRKIGTGAVGPVAQRLQRAFGCFVADLL